MNKQSRNRLTDTEIRGMVARGAGGRGLAVLHLRVLVGKPVTFDLINGRAVTSCRSSVFVCLFLLG